MPRQRSRTKTPAPSEVEQLAIKSAREIADIVRRALPHSNRKLPLADWEVNQLLGETIESLRSQGKIPWYGTSLDRRQVFIDAWATEMSRLGIRD